MVSGSTWTLCLKEGSIAKRVVICCDGTGNEFGTQNSNVIDLYQPKHPLAIGLT
jgi:uncharacterized protein (DUF2235 family)